MENWQKGLVIVFGVITFIGSIKGLSESKNKKNAYGLTPYLFPFGIFVWGDAVVFGLFWTLVSIVVYLVQDWILFLLIFSVFWAVRSFGETIYWFNQQFSKINRNPPEKFRLYKIFHDDSVWFIFQIFFQCIAVISIIFSIYLAKIWF